MQLTPILRWAAWAVFIWCLAMVLLVTQLGGRGPAAAAAVDTTPPVVKMDRALHFVVGSTLGDSTSTPVVSTVNWKWRQSDPSGICSEAGSMDWWVPGEQFHRATGFTGVRTSWRFPALVDRAYYSFIQASDCVGNSTPQYVYEQWEYRDDLPIYTLRLLQEGSAQYGAGWTTGACKCWSGGTVMRSSKARQTATFTSTFTDFALVTTKGPGRGTADIYVDGVKRASINDAAATTTNRRVSFRVNMPGAATEHTVSVRVTSGRIDIDAFLIN